MLAGAMELHPFAHAMLRILGIFSVEGEFAMEKTQGGTMRALVYHGMGQRAWEERARPVLQAATDAIVRITRRNERKS